MDRIVISGIRELGVHGVLPEEHTRPQPFEVDIELLIDLSRAGSSDDLADTVDYGRIHAEVATIITDEHHRLLERLATRVTEVCRRDARVKGVIVEVRKMEPPIDGNVGYVAVRIER